MYRSADQWRYSRVGGKLSEVATEVKALRRLDAVQHSLVNFRSHVLSISHADVDASNGLGFAFFVPLKSLERRVDQLHHVAEEALGVFPRLPVAHDVVKLVCAGDSLFEKPRKHNLYASRHDPQCMFQTRFLSPPLLPLTSDTLRTYVPHHDDREKTGSEPKAAAEDGNTKYMNTLDLVFKR